MKSSLILCVCGLLAVGLAGCSNGPTRQPLEASGGVTLDGADLGPADRVACHREGGITMISTGTDEAGTNSVVDNRTGLAVRSVEIRNLAGFSGTYLQNLQGQAKVDMSGRTIVLTGEASGFTAQQPNRRTDVPFTIRVTC